MFIHSAYIILGIISALIKGLTSPAIKKTGVVGLAIILSIALPHHKEPK